ncbi:MAG: hypothetical protein LUE87_01850, partial [Lachnospiraceae bacterium]|nr:hypothetical protein [Lachnospiraceae bacterium]
TYYGLIHADRQNYEPFEVVKELPDGSVKISKPLAEPFSANSPIARIVFGMAGEQGDYVLRVRDDAETLIYMIRYVVRGAAKFRTVDMHRAEELK